MAFGGRARFLTVGALATMTMAVTPLPAMAAGSPPPKVKIGALSNPTTGPGGEKVYTFDVTARDRDGIITGVTVELEGPNHHTGRSVAATCIPGAAPGQRFTFQVSESLGAGRYRVSARASSAASCENFGGGQSSRLVTRRFLVRS